MARERRWFADRGAPAAVEWRYDRAELLADAFLHVVGVALALIGGVILVGLAVLWTRGIETASVVIYAASLLTVLGFSAAYNMWPVSPGKWLLRRFDHSAIYLLIAATYTPFVAQMKTSVVAPGFLVGLWLVAAVGIFAKICLPGRFDRLSVVVYLGMGWSGVLLHRSIAEALSSAEIGLLAAGGLFYSAGVAFHAWRSLRFQNAIWHGFVLVAAACHYAAVLLSL